MTDLIITNGVLGWVGLRLVKRVDALDNKVDDHEARLQVDLSPRLVPLDNKVDDHEARLQVTEHQLEQRG